MTFLNMESSPSVMVGNRKLKGNSEIEDCHCLNSSRPCSSTLHLPRGRLNPERPEDWINPSGLPGVSFCPSLPRHCIISLQTGFLISSVTWQTWPPLHLQVHMQLSPDSSSNFWRETLMDQLLTIM